MDNDTRLAPVASYNSQLEADLVRGRLESAGIKAYVRSDGLGGTFPGMPMATGGFQVMVAEASADAERIAQHSRLAVADLAGSARRPGGCRGRFGTPAVLSRLSPCSAASDRERRASRRR